MKKKTFINIVLLILLVVFTLNKVNAITNSFDAELEIDSTNLKPGEEITISLKVSNINMGDDGINALEGTIKYDTNVFETITQTDITSENGWSTTYNEEEENSLKGKFLAVNLSAGTKEDTQILTVKFKVKDNVEETTKTKIDFVDITSNDGVDLVNVGTKSIQITVNVPQKPIQENEIINETNNDNENKAPGTIPQTGVTPISVITISIITMVCIYIGIKYKNMKDIG